MSPTRTFGRQFTWPRAFKKESNSRPEDPPSASLPATPIHAWWRNMHYGEEDHNRRLEVRNDPHCQGKVVAQMQFGQRFQVAESRSDGRQVWLRLLDMSNGDPQWVPAMSCLEILPWRDHKGRIPRSATNGISFPKDLQSEGFGGGGDTALVSASGYALWRELNIEALCRDIAVTALYERRWTDGPGFSFKDWALHYGMNFGQYAAGKNFVAVVKPTENWRKFAEGCTGVDLDELAPDIGQAQRRELSWIHDNQDSIPYRWKDMEFRTAFSFFKRYCCWTPEDCRKAALGNLTDFCRGYHEYEAPVTELDCAYWLWREAFDEEPLEVHVRAAAVHHVLRGLVHQETKLPLGGDFRFHSWEQLECRLRELVPEFCAEALRHPMHSLMKELLSVVQASEGRSTRLSV